MSDQVIHCAEGDHEWLRPHAVGAIPKSCPKHKPLTRGAHSAHKVEDQRLRIHCGSEVVAGEVIQWVRSLGLEVHPRLKGKVADILVARYNREHPDRPYVRTGGAA